MDKNSQAKFKETEIGPIPEGWDVLEFGKAVDINPKRAIKKGNNVKFVAMTDINPFNKKITNFSRRNFAGGSKFKNGDTLMARITPCLENGKTAFVDLLEKDEIAGGSTEFIVISGKKDVSDSNFAYYLTISPTIRTAAIQAMTGTSGRQRVETDKLERQLIGLPKINKQRQIAEILGALDEKIELNRRMNDTLEKIASAIFKHWFVDFEFPNKQCKPYKSTGGKMIDSELGAIPEAWKVGKLGEIITLNYGKALKGENRNDGNIKVYGSSGFVGFHNEKLVTGPGIVIGRKGNVGSVYWVDLDFYPIDTTYFVESKLPLVFCYYLLKNQNFINGDSVVPGLNRNQAYLNQIILPDKRTIENFSNNVIELRNTISFIEKQTNSLSQIRDSLLPKLMSGMIRTK